MPDIKYFISYAHADTAYYRVFKNELQSQLKNVGFYNFTKWDDAEIPVGSEWDKAISDNLNAADLAILCVTSNFFNSQYIKEKEWGVLLKHPEKIVIPVYFNHCNFATWETLGRKQFFKPGGENYGKPASKSFAFCDLVEFDSKQELIPDSDIPRYCLDLKIAIEKALDVIYKPKPVSSLPDPPVKNPAEETGPTIPPAVKRPSLDFMTRILIVTVMAISAVIVFYFLFSSKTGEEKKFGSIIGGGMFFGCIAGYSFINTKPKSQHE